MKKRQISLLAVVAILCVAVGFTAYPTNTNKNIQGDSVGNVEERANIGIAEEIVGENETETAAQENGTSLSAEASKTEIMSDEDKMVKAEIAKHINTDVDFRNSKKEIIKGKSFDVVFFEADSTADYKRIIYKNNLGDEFAYNTDNGKLRYAVMDSVVTEKTAASIDKTTAQKIATEYVSTKCNIEQYTVDYFKESDKGYYFCFTRYIGGYPSNDIYGIKVGYTGDIVYLSDNTDLFADRNISFDKNFIDKKIKEATDESQVDWNSVTICIYEGKVAVSYAVSEQCATAILPLE